jgi:endonuclease YncB( thermonuclease family)
MGDDFDFRAMLRARRTGRSPKIVPLKRRESRKGKYAAGWMLVAGLVLGAAAGTVGLRWSGELLPSAAPPATSDSQGVAGTYDVAELEAHRRKAQREAEAARRQAERRSQGSAPDRSGPVQASASLGIGCVSPEVVDGDTLRCGSTRIRLSSIDAPEMPGHCRPGRQCTPGDPYASTDHLRALVSGSAVACRQIDTDHYGRAVALCSAGGRDLSCEQVRSGHAIIRYGSLSC